MLDLLYRCVFKSQCIHSKLALNYLFIDNQIPPQSEENI